VDRLEAMRVFVAVAEAESFASAARKLALSAPVVTRAVAALEQRIGSRLFRRTTRIVKLTQAGERFLGDAKRILRELEQAERAAADLQLEPRGQLSITAPLMFGRLHVAPVVLEYLTKHPRVFVRALFSDQVVDILEEGLDVAVRIGRLEDSSLSATRVGSLRRVVCASPAYLAKHGRPSAPVELADHQLIAFTGINPHRHWSFRAHGKVETVQAAPRLVVNTADVGVAAAKAGHGLTRVLSYQVDAELRARELEIVLAAFEPPEVPVHVVHAGGRAIPASVRAFVDLTVRRLRSALRPLGKS
jgi:DNA-binding transcriptional LysR family regulator